MLPNTMRTLHNHRFYFYCQFCVDTNIQSIDKHTHLMYHFTHKQKKWKRIFFRIREQAERYGICKIVPPQEWHPPCKIDMKNPAKFPTKLQQVRTVLYCTGRYGGVQYSSYSIGHS